MDRQKLGTFVLGGVAGAVAGILAAPRSGRETRGSILNRAGEARERSREGYFEASERARERRSGRGNPFFRGSEPSEPPEMTLGDTRPDEETLSEDSAPEASEQPEAPPGEAPPGESPLRAVTPEESAVSSEEREELRRRVERTRQRLRGRGSPGEDS